MQQSHSPHYVSRRTAIRTWLAAFLGLTSARAGTIISPDPIGVGEGKIGADTEVLKKAIDFSPFMTETDPLKTPLECIDGRPPVDVDALVGAKLAGGVVSLQSAFAICGNPLNDTQTLALFGPNGRLPYVPGWHIDTDHSIDGKEPTLKAGIEGTGCGASDKQKAILHNFVTQSAKVSPIVQSILWTEFDASLFDHLVRTTKEDVPHDARGLASLLAERRQRGTVDVLATWEHHDANHGHHESYVLINTVPNTTLDNTLLQKAHEHAQAFCVDVWLLKDIAQKLYPDNAVEQKKYLHALVAYQVATYITLANGSQKVAIISE